MRRGQHFPIYWQLGELEHETEHQENVEGCTYCEARQEREEMNTRDNSISIWSDGDTGEYIFIGREVTRPGEEFLCVPLDKDSILEWIRVLIHMLDDGDICDVPGEVVTKEKEVGG